MKLVHPALNHHIDFSQNQIQSLIIENQREYFKLTKELYLQCQGENGDFVLSENEILNISKECLFIYDFFNNFSNSKKTTTIINEKILKILQTEDFFEEFATINASISKIIDKIDLASHLSLLFNENFDNETFLKIVKPHLINSGDFLEDLITFIELNSEEKNIKVIILVGSFNFLNKIELNMLIKQLKYLQLNLLLIDPLERYELPNVNRIIIDKDLCEI